MNKVTWNGVEYPSMSEASKAAGVSAGVMMNRMRTGYSFEEALKVPSRKRGLKRWVEWQGERVSMAQLAKRYGKSNDVVTQRMLRGWTLESALTEEARVMKRSAVVESVDSVEQAVE